MSHDSSRLLLAATFASDKHRDQRRKDCDASPYINHPLAVASVLASEGDVTDMDLLIAALLHDTIEDTETSSDEIVAMFGQEVSVLVGEVTDDKSLPSRRRKELQIEKAPHKSDRAKQLKIADKICNVRDINQDSPANWDAARKTQYLDWACRVVEGCRGVNPSLDQLFDETIATARERVENLV